MSAERTGGGGGSNAPQPYLTNMWIEWCDGKGNVYTRWIDVTKISSLAWRSGAVPPGNHPATPKIPGSKKHKVANVTCSDPPPSGGECCYWDGTQWVCPNDFDG